MNKHFNYRYLFLHQPRKSNLWTGQGIIEVVVGIFFLVILLLAFVDFFALVIGKLTNDDLLMKATRAASRAQNLQQAQVIVQQIQQANAKPIILDVTAFNIPGQNPAGGGAPPGEQKVSTPTGYCTVQSKMTITLPVPVPFTNINSWTLQDEMQVPLTSFAAQ